MHTICGATGRPGRIGQILGMEPHFHQLGRGDQNPEIDIVDINTPNDSHAEIAIAAAKAGKHVLLQKPLAMTVDQCQEMVDAAAQSASSTWYATTTDIQPLPMQGR